MDFSELERINSLEWPLGKKVNSFYSASVTVAQFAEEMIIPILRCQLDLNLREQAITGTYYRMFAWMKTLSIMNGPLYYQAVAAGTRSLFELMLDLKLLTDDKKPDNLQRFLAFPEIEKYRVARALTEFREAHPDSSDDDSTQMRGFLGAPGRAGGVELQQVTHYGRDAKGKPVKPRHWTGQDMAQRARDAGEQYQSWYMDLWSRLSWHMHSGSVGYAGLSEEGMHALVCLAHHHAQLFFLNGTVLCARAMKLTAAIESFYAIIDRLETLPGEIMVREQLDFIRQQGKV